MIMGRAESFESDTRLAVFEKAAIELAQDEKVEKIKSNCPPSKSCEELSKISTKDLVAVARLSQEDIMTQITSAADTVKIKNLLSIYHQLETDVNAHYIQKFSGSKTKMVLGIPNLRSSSVDSGLRSASIASPEPAGQLNLCARINLKWWSLPRHRRMPSCSSSESPTMHAAPRTWRP